MAKLKSQFIKEPFSNYYTFFVFLFSGNIYTAPPSIWSQRLLHFFKAHCKISVLCCFIIIIFLKKAFTDRKEVDIFQLHIYGTWNMYSESLLGARCYPKFT